jgi:hypothetical protein
MMDNAKKLNNIIEALSRHEDGSAVTVLEEVGTNCPDDEVRRLTSRALVKRNTRDSLSIIILESGKGINDLSTNVAMSTINELLSLEDKSQALEILNQVEEDDFEDNIKETARSVKALMAFS